MLSLISQSIETRPRLHLARVVNLAKSQYTEWQLILPLTSLT
jgi:hypothetical protein